MPTPGESLKREREAQNKTLEEMAEATAIRLDYLAALEQDSFEALPGRGFGKLYIRAYAEVLGFDPRPIIQEYDRALNAREASPDRGPTPSGPRPIEAALARWREERMAARQGGVKEIEEEEKEEEEIEEEFEQEKGIEEPPAPEPALPVEVVTPTEPPAFEPVPPAVTESTEPWQSTIPPARRSRRWPAVAAVVVLATGGLALWLKQPNTEPSPPGTRATPAPTPAAPPLAMPAAPSPTPKPTQPARKPAPAEPSHLTVTESAVGVRQVGGRVEGSSDHYPVGQRVVFVTRVMGGKAGERIRHVWMRDGKVEQGIGLRLGAANFRTYSAKTLGRPGAWAVEARDEQGIVLARVDFACAP